MRLYNTSKWMVVMTNELSVELMFFNAFDDKNYFVYSGSLLYFQVSIKPQRSTIKIFQSVQELPFLLISFLYRICKRNTKVIQTLICSQNIHTYMT